MAEPLTGWPWLHEALKERTVNDDGTVSIDLNTWNVLHMLVVDAARAAAPSGENSDSPAVESPRETAGGGAYDLTSVPPAPGRAAGLRAVDDHVWRYKQGEKHLAGCCLHPGEWTSAAPLSETPLDVETLMEWLHDLDGTQHYITHETGYDGDDLEGVACLDGLESHREDAQALAVRLAGASE